MSSSFSFPIRHRRPIPSRGTHVVTANVDKVAVCTHGSAMVALVANAVYASSPRNALIQISTASIIAFDLLPTASKQLSESESAINKLRLVESSESLMRRYSGVIEKKKKGIRF